jgi:hypothetical protein
LAPGFSRVFAATLGLEPLERFSRIGKPLKRLEHARSPYTRLKPGANESIVGSLKK